MLNMITQPPTTPAKLLFQECVAASSSEANYLAFIKNGISGYLLENINPTKVSKTLWDKTFAFATSIKKTNQNLILDPSYKDLPLILQNFLSSKQVKWKNYSDVKVANLTHSSESDKLELIHVMPGGSIPQHTHEGEENFLVLHGSYTDEYGNYTEGSVQTRDESHDHKPVGDPITGCIGLAYSEGKIKFSGKFSKILNLFNN
ncbi:cupin domain-containing protein [Alphaproteobacteria bacterium]|nr:cupin domain-containing protein [Alphaproteobacteria bacterium]